MARLERGGYILVKKSIIGKMPHTQYWLTPRGRKALQKYWAAIDKIRALGKIK